SSRRRHTRFSRDWSSDVCSSDLMFDSVPGVLQHIQAGKLRALGVTSLKRSAALPDVPTLDEAGVKGFEAMAWFGLYAPGNMPPRSEERRVGKEGSSRWAAAHAKT